jgi:hypothetical protein
MDFEGLRKTLTSKRVDRYQYRTDVRVDLTARPSLLQIIVDAVVANGCQ